MTGVGQLSRAGRPAGQEGEDVAVLGQVEQGEGNVVRVVRQRLTAQLAGFFGGAGLGRPGGEVAEGAEPALADHSSGGFADDAEDAADLTALTPDGIV